MRDYRKIAIDLHDSVNHKYDEYSYKLHLDAVEAAHQEFKDELDLKLTFTMDVSEKDKEPITNTMITNACYFHDTLEDCRLTYNDLKTLIGLEAVEIVYAVTNSKGRTRAERADSTYYLNIRQTPGASFVKICDRIANIRYSRLMGSSMYEKYRKENDHFMINVGADKFPRMKETLINLFK